MKNIENTINPFYYGRRVGKGNETFILNFDLSQKQRMYINKHFNEDFIIEGVSDYELPEFIFNTKIIDLFYYIKINKPLLTIKEEHVGKIVGNGNQLFNLTNDLTQRELYFIKNMISEQFVRELTDEEKEIVIEALPGRFGGGYSTGGGGGGK